MRNDILIDGVKKFRIWQEKHLAMKKNNIESIVSRSIKELGETDWYSNLHCFRFCDLITKVEALLPHGSKGLEVGCWPGYLGSALQFAGYDIVGIDLKKNSLSGFNFDIAKLDLNVDPLPMADNFFDFVTFSEVLEHLKERRVSKIFAEIKRVLKPSGILFVTTPNRLRLGSRFGRIENFPDGFGHGHEREYSVSEIKGMAANAGFDLIEAKTISFYAGVGREDGKRYFYPLTAFLRHSNKRRNFAKLLAYPFIKYVPQWRDSTFLILKK